MYSRPCRSEKYLLPPPPPPHLFNSRINNNEFLLQRLLFIFCSCWRRLLLKDKFFTCLFVESVSLPLIISAIVIFIATDVAMTIIFISSSFISPSLFSLLVVFLSFFFFIQKIQCEWCGYPSCPFSVTWEILSVEMVDGRQSWRLTAERCIIY